MLKEESNEFKYPAVRIQAHLNEIENFLKVIEIHPEILKKITTLLIGTDTNNYSNPYFIINIFLSAS